uniref:CHY-type domain-containing protein n=1 Tax=Dendroctonus ponderosae TaxID=77166 RepID=J3JVB9_DENPD|nr:unknown [Dendroctonus ponderosae]
MKLSSTPEAESPSEEAVKTVGCAHYKRKSKFVTPCCQKVYTCRFCHDENENHTMNRKEVTELICTVCYIRQPVKADCENCGVRFGKYVCLECNLFDDEEKNQFHCQGCGICRIGGAERFFHCKKMQHVFAGATSKRPQVCRKCIAIKLSSLLGGYPYFPHTVPHSNVWTPSA